MLAINSSGQEIVPELLKVFTGQTTKLGDPSPLRKQIVLVLVVVLILEFHRSTPLLSTGPKVENEHDDENEND
jgi:hypothetical protein